MINFRCLLQKTDFRIFYFELETLLNKLVKYVVICLREKNLNQNTECLIFIKKVNGIRSTYFYCNIHPGGCH